MKPTASLCGALRRTRLTTKQARKGYYKGTGTGILGHWDPANPRKFVVDWEKVRTFKYPEMGLDNFPV
jgi:large subunit ribosomal protein L41